MATHSTVSAHDGHTHSAPAVSELSVEGMTCSNCARHVSEAVQGVPGVRSAMVELGAGRVSVRWEPNAEKNVPAVLRAVQEAGYSAKPMESMASDHAHGAHAGRTGWRFNLWIGVLGTLSLMLGEWVFRLGATDWFRWFAFAVGTLVQILAGAQFYRGAWKQLKQGSSNMDTLVALGSTTAYVYSVWVLFAGQGQHLYFMEAAAIITLISLGHWMEARVSGRASSALRQLLNLAPQIARKIGPNNQVLEAPAAELIADDVVLLRPGDRVPTDGTVVEGDSAVDESMLTGESVPVDKSVQSPLYAGTTNLNGRLVMRVTATGEETALAQIIAAVQRAQSSRANIQRLGDKVSSVFVPVVVLIAIAAGVWWGVAPDQAMRVNEWLGQYLWEVHPPAGPLAAAFITAAAVLIIACPCAMGLATPAAIMAGSNAAARRGILIRDGVALEKAGNLTGVIFDKTGTLTAGKPAVAAVWERGGDGRPAARDLAASLAEHSAHPVSQAIAQAGGGNGDGKAEVQEWQEARGAGVQARWRTPGNQWSLARLGALKWLRESGVNISQADAFVQKWSAEGATLVGLAVESDLAGLFALKDTIKPAAPAVLRELHRQGLKTWLVTGDNALTAAAIARQIGIRPEHVHAEVRPEQKAEFVRNLQGQGERVAFVGDGINDAPALEQADLGIVVSRASDVAREAADLILLKSEIEAVPESLGLARATLRTIKQNLFWAFFYNAIGVPLAALGFISPILCAAAMGFSDLVVIGNALRLLRWKVTGRRMAG